MKFISKVTPNMKQKRSTHAIMLDLLLALLVVYAFALVYQFTTYGMDAVLKVLAMLGVSLGVMLVSESLFAIATKVDVKTFLKNSFGYITSLILVLMCQTSVSLFAIGVGTFVAIFFGKLIFGGFGHNIFNPAALGRAVILAAFSGIATDATTGATVLAKLQEFSWMPNTVEGLSGGMDSVLNSTGGLLDLFIGFRDGALGETFIGLLLVLGIILAIRNVIDYRQPLLYLGTIAIMSAVVALVGGVEGWYAYPLVHIMGGGVVFGAIFMLTDPVTNPTSVMGRIIYPVGAGIITMLIRLLGQYPEGCLFSILIMNMLTPLIERVLDGKNRKTFVRGLIITGVLVVVAVASSLFSAQQLLAKRQDQADAIAAEKNKPAPKVGLDDDVMRAYEARIDSKTENADGTITYVVSAQGYHSIEDKSQFNTFTIVVDKASTTVKSVEVTTNVDTPYVGDKINDQDYLDTLVGINLSDMFEVEVSDVVTGATYSVKSSVRALYEIRLDLGIADMAEPTANVVSASYEMVQGYEGEVLSTSDNGDGTTTYAVKAQGYHSLSDATQFNEFSIVVENETGVVKSVSITKMSDTEYIGDKIEDETFLEGLAQMNLNNDVAVEQTDAVTGATYSLGSLVKALDLVKNAIGK